LSVCSIVVHWITQWLHVLPMRACAYSATATRMTDKHAMNAAGEYAMVAAYVLFRSEVYTLSVGCGWIQEGTNRSKMHCDSWTSQRWQN
jgi:hypothetical protein